MGTPARPRILAINTFAIEPVVSGGKLRLFGLVPRTSAQDFDVRFVNLADTALPRHAKKPLAAGLGGRSGAGVGEALRERLA
ncbi:hypothetical protein ACU4GD_14765 [Cupriavidus basilensis]